MNQFLYKNKTLNLFKTWLLFAGFLGFVIAFGFAFAQIYQNSSILYFAVILSVGTALFSYWFSDKMVLAMVKAKPVSKDSAPELYDLVSDLAKEANLPLPKIYIVEENAPNAFATGRNPKHAVVAVTTGILRKLNKDELRGVLAHELSHVANRDMLVGTVAVILVGFISIASDFFMRSMLWGGMRRDSRNQGGTNIIFLIIGVILAMLAPLAATLMRLAISRKRELLADSSGALLTRKPENLASALIKISSDSTPMLRANNANSHLWFDDPFDNKPRTPFLHKLFMSHPPTEERVKNLRGLKI
ncbi:MAG: M48 family metalloprotease [Candidatus Harrisonbacteria bacterium]|nr:M48 family metalloprotease [Candidatus Harrisonbacteria bacterium]